MDTWLNEIPGAQELAEWFGSWPSFHDAEVLSVELNRTGPSKVSVHTWAITDKIDSRGFYVCERNCIVTFWIEDLSAVQLAHFNNQNALSDLDFYKKDGDFVLYFAPAHGLDGEIHAKSVRIEFSPGGPSNE